MWKKKCQHLQMWRRDAIFRARERGTSPTRRFLEETEKCQQHGGGWVLHEEGRDVSSSVVALRKLFLPGRKKLHGWKGPTLLLILKRSAQKSAQNSTEKSRMLPGIFLRDFTSSLALKNSRILPHGGPFSPSLSLSLPPMASNNGACATMGEGGMWWALTQNRARRRQWRGGDIFSPAGCPCCSTSLLPYFNDQ